MPHLTDNDLTFDAFVDIVARIHNMGHEVATTIAHEFFAAPPAMERSFGRQDEAAWQIALWAWRRAQELQKAA